jgi:hypothetical protein
MLKGNFWVRKTIKAAEKWYAARQERINKHAKRSIEWRANIIVKIVRA